MVRPESALARSAPDFLGIIWRLGSGTVAGLVLSLLLLMTLGLTAAFPQQPAELSGAAAEQWLSAIPASYHALGPALRILGVFDVWNGLWVRFLLAAVAYHLLLRTARTALSAWRALSSASVFRLLSPRRGSVRPADRRPPLPPAPIPAEAVTVPGSPGPLRQGLQVALETREGYRCDLVIDTPSWIVLYGERRSWAALAPFGVCLGCLLMLLGLLLNNLGGWTVSGLALARGVPTEVPQSGGLEARLEAIDGPPGNPISSVLLARPGGASAQALVGYVRPALCDGLWLVQQSTGAALAVSAQNDRGRPVLLQSVTTPMQSPIAHEYVTDTLHVLFTATQTEQVFAMPANDMAFRVVDYPALPAHGITAAVFLVEAYRGNDPAPAVSKLVNGEASLVLDHITYHFQEDRHTVLGISYLPGAAPLALGALLVLAGTIISLWWGRSEVWVSLTPRAQETLAFVRTRSLPGSGAEGHRLKALLVALAGDLPP